MRLVFFIIIVLGLFELIMSGDIIGTPICMIFIYLLMSLRAGKIKWKKAKITIGNEELETGFLVHIDNDNILDK